MTEQERIKKALSGLRASGDTLTEVLKMANETKQVKRFTGKRVAMVAVAAALVLALAVGAYAANPWGIRELWSNSNRELPEEAAELIEPRNESGAAAEGWSVRLTESLCDGDVAMLALTVSGGDDYIVAPTDASPEDGVSALGLDGDETLGDYAAARGKTLLFVGADLPHGEELGIAHQSQTFRSISDGELAILIQAEKGVSASSVDTVCTVYALEAGRGSVEDVQRVEIPVALTWTPAAAR